MTADRKRKLQDVSNGLTLLGLCPLLVHIWEKNGSPLISAQVSRDLPAFARLRTPSHALSRPLTPLISAPPSTRDLPAFSP